VKFYNTRVISGRVHSNIIIFLSTIQRRISRANKCDDDRLNDDDDDVET